MLLLFIKGFYYFASADRSGDVVRIERALNAAAAPALDVHCRGRLVLCPYLAAARRRAWAEKGVSVILSLNLHGALCKAVQRGAKFGGAFE